ncbi:MAG: hypothetical protein D6778_04015, partial [Nitrospirae bacterium]
MSDIFLIGLREAIQACFMVGVLSLCPDIRKRALIASVLVLSGALSGFFIGLGPLLGFGEVLKAEVWNLLRVTFDILVLYLGLVFFSYKKLWP